MLTLGSLFDGIGGFPLAGVMCGIKPVWSSEIEPFPLKVTAARFPDMKQLGSVTDINGAEIEPVDIITFGSPCQDLSVAGKQKGIHDGERSNLFFEAVRIIKEMRDADKANGWSGVDIRPRFAVWENVPGAFSSNGGEDFKAVLEALSGVMQDGLDIPRPKKWNHAGGVAGDGWSIAWRVYDAQYWGVPQRRKRIYLVADFASERAGEILFERESVSGHPSEGGAPWEGTAADAERSVGGSGGTWSFKERAGKPGGGKGFLSGHERAFMLSTNVDQSVCYGIDQQGGKGTATFTEDISPTLCSDSHGTPHGVCFEPKSLMEENWSEQTVKNALRANASKSGHCVVEPAAFMGGQGAKAGGIAYSNGLSPTLKASPSGGNTVPDVVYALQGNGIDRSDTAGCNGCGWRTEQMYTLNTIDRPAIAATIGSFMASNEGGVSLTLMARDFKDPQIVCYDARGNGDGNTTPTLTGDHQNRVTDYTALAVGNGQLHQTDLGDKVGALNCMHDQQAVVHDGKPPRKYIVRRLTPTECARLQGMPDWWCEGLEGSDSAIYKAYGNGLALPCAYDVLRRIAKEYDQTPVLQSIHKD